MTYVYKTGKFLLGDVQVATPDKVNYVFWMTKRYENGEKTAETLAFHYYLEKDYTNTHKWALLSDSGYSKFLLGSMYYLGEGVPMDSEVAKKWFSQGAELENRSSKTAIEVFHRQNNPAFRQKFKIFLRENLDAIIN